MILTSEILHKRQKSCKLSLGSTRKTMMATGRLALWEVAFLRYTHEFWSCWHHSRRVEGPRLRKGFDWAISFLLIDLSETGVVAQIREDCFQVTRVVQGNIFIQPNVYSSSSPNSTSPAITTFTFSPWSYWGALTPKWKRSQSTKKQAEETISGKQLLSEILANFLNDDDSSQGL